MNKRKATYYRVDGENETFRTLSELMQHYNLFLTEREKKEYLNTAIVGYQKNSEEETSVHYFKLNKGHLVASRTPIKFYFC